jgi:integrase/recombinase XerD
MLAANPMDHDIVPRPKVSKGLPKPLTLEEANAIVAVAGELDERARRPWPDRDVAIAVTLLATGVRLSELSGARLGDIQRLGDTYDPNVPGSSQGARLRVSGKGAKTRVVPLYPEAERVIDRYLLSRRRRLGPVKGTDVLFVRSDATAFTSRALRRLADRWFARAGVPRPPGASVHALRHTFATLSLDGSANVLELQQLLGHTSLSTTQRYLAVVGSGLDDAVLAHPTRALARAAADGAKPA